MTPYEALFWYFLVLFGVCLIGALVAGIQSYAEKNRTNSLFWYSVSNWFRD